jgi:hypothetical protein
MVQQLVLPIKDSNILKMVQDTLLDSFRAGRRNYTIFREFDSLNDTKVL